MTQVHNEDIEKLCAVPYDDDNMEEHEPKYGEELEHCGVIMSRPRSNCSDSKRNNQP